MKDNVLGNIEYQDGAWIREETIEVYGKSRDISIEIRADNQKSPLDIQKKAYQLFLSNRENYLKQMPLAFLNEYIFNYEDIQKRFTFSDNSPLLKENINEVVIMQTVAPLVLLIDEKGNYGWICKCGWTEDKTIAILLSEETPRILTPSQLYDYRKIDDPVFGEMIYDASWEKREKKLLYGKEKLVRIATCDYKDGITDVHRASYRKYQENEARYLEEIPRVLLEYYLSMYDEIKEYWRVPRAYTKKNVTQENIMDLIDFRTLYFMYNGMFAWLCECPWEEECGIAFVLSDEKVRVELQTDIL